MKLSRFNTIVQLFFALILVVAQGELLIHQVDLEEHADQSVCEVCIHTSHIGSGVAGEINAATFPVEVAAYSTVNHAPVEISFYYVLAQPRAPPFSSLS